MRLLLTLLLVSFTAFPALCQSNAYKEGQACFDSANYTCAINKFTEAVKLLEGKDKQIAEINLTRAKTCAEWLKAANQAFNSGNYTTAKENYQSILDENPNDTYAAKQIERCNDLIKSAKPALRKATAQEVRDICDGKYGNLEVRRQNLINKGIDPDDVQKRINGGECKQSEPQKTTLRKATAQEIRDICDGKYGNFEVRRQSLINKGIDPDDVQRRINNGECITPAPKQQVFTLSLSQSTISFNSDGGTSFQIRVNTNANDFQVSLVPSWCTVQTYSTYFIVTCKPNTSNASRSDWLRVRAGDQVKSLTIIQEGVPKQQVTRLSVSNDNISFTGDGGQSEKIRVSSNGKRFEVSLVPSWCNVVIHDGYFIVKCQPNNSREPRSNWFKVSTSNEEIRVIVRQGGKEPKSKKNSSSSSLQDCFNCPKSKNTLGLTVGYARLALNTDYLHGAQFGLRIEPLFKYGFGLNTGLLLETYFDNEGVLNPLNSSAIGLYALNIPFHLQYRLNFSKKFNLFAYGGVSFNAVTDANFEEYSLPMNYEYGGGFRTGRVQFNVGQSLNAGNLRDIEKFGGRPRRYQNIVISMTYFF